MYTLAPAFVAAALSAVETLPPAQRADHYDFAAEVLKRFGHKGAAKAAQDVGRTLRESEAAQLHFLAVLSPAKANA